MITFYIPRDSAARSVGADEVANAITHEAARRQLPVRIVRNGSWGMFWLEPLVEVATPAGRIAYGPVSAADVPGLFDAGVERGAPHPLRQGLTTDIAYLKNQERLTFARVGLTDPLSLEDYRANEGLLGLERALAMTPAEVVEAVTTSGLRGRGGAAFPTGIKWRTVLNTESTQKYIVCNADEGDSGTFSDRMIMEDDPYTLIEGMTIAGIAVGATQGFIYLRFEYPDAWQTLNDAIARAYAAGVLGASVLGSGRRFDLEVRLGAGAYICGEETSLLESLEGKRGQIRFKPPLPAVQGLFGKPTVINNVISLATVPVIFARGAEYYRDFGMGRSRGTLPLQLTGNLARGGLVEKAFGLKLSELLYDFGGGSASGRPLRTVQVGGPLGAYLPESLFDTLVDYEAFTAVGGMLGHGGLVAFDDTVNLAKMARYAFEFCALESCGKCTPCRIGSTRGVEVMDRLLAASNKTRELGVLNDLCETMTHGSLCALGGLTPLPVQSAIRHFPEDFGLPNPASLAQSA